MARQAAAASARGGRWPRGGLDADAVAGRQLLHLVLEPLQQPRASAQRRLDALQRARRAPRRPRRTSTPSGCRSHSTSRPVLARRRGRAPGGGRRGGRPRSGWPAFGGGFRPVRGTSAAAPPSPGRAARGRPARRPPAAASNSGVSPASSSSRRRRPRARAAAALGAEHPAAQLGRLRPRQRGAKAAVGGVEQVVALVEDDAQRAPAVLGPPPSAAWVSTRAWLAMTRSARRARRIAFSTKQVR